MKQLLRNKYVREIINILLIVVGTFIMGFAFNSFFDANNIAPGGFGGLAAVISDFLVKLGFVRIAPTFFYLAFNVGFIIWAFFVLGKKYICYSLLGIALYSVFIQFLKIDLAISDLFLASFFGAILIGFGTALVVRCGGSTGGGEMLGNIVHQYKPNITIGKFIIFVDIIVLLFSFYTYGLTNSLYTIFAIVIDGIVVDKVLYAGKERLAFYIISEKHVEIASQIMQKPSKGVTCIQATGSYTSKERDILLCLIDKYEIDKLKAIVFETDENAFVFNTKISEALGSNFERHKKPITSIFKKKKNKVEYVNKNESNKDEKSEF